MTKKFTAIIIGVNMLLLGVLFVSGDSVMAYLASASHQSPPLMISSFNVFNYVMVPYQGGSSPAPAFAESMVYWPCYVFILGLILNIAFAIKLLLAKDTS